MEAQERSLFKRCIAKWGTRNQFDQANEEMAELMIELHKIRRGRAVGLNDLASEVADVSIMLDQIRVVYGPDFEEVVAIQREHKIKRLEGRVGDVNHKGN